MADATIRVGKISSIDYVTGKARIVYEDRDNNVTVELPISSLEDTGLIREQDSVLVAHLSNGTANGIIVGRFHANSNPPVKGKKDLYRKDFSRNADEAYLQYDEQQLIIEAPDFVVVTKEGREQIIPKLLDHEQRIKTLEKKVKTLEDKVVVLEKIAQKHEEQITGLGG